MSLGSLKSSFSFLCVVSTLWLSSHTQCGSDIPFRYCTVHWLEPQMDTFCGHWLPYTFIIIMHELCKCWVTTAWNPKYAFSAATSQKDQGSVIEFPLTPSGIYLNYKRLQKDSYFGQYSQSCSQSLFVSCLFCKQPPQNSYLVDDNNTAMQRLMCKHALLIEKVAVARFLLYDKNSNP